MNSLMFIGKVKDKEYKTLDSGLGMAVFNLMMDVKQRDREGYIYVNGAIFGKQASTADQDIGAGDKVAVSGTINRSDTAKGLGIKINSLEVVTKATAAASNATDRVNDGTMPSAEDVPKENKADEDEVPF